MQNCWEALVSMKDGKSPGNDGLTKEFFVCFLRVLRVIRVIDDILYHAEQENLDGIVFAADMEKAFDSLEHNFIFSTLIKFGFGQKFIQWVRTSQRNGSSCVMNNGVSTRYFNPERGARQGYPLSPYLFILCLETLFIQIRNDKSIRGFKFRKIEIKLTSFADDVTFLVKDTQSLRKIFKLIKKIWNTLFS